MGLPVLDLDYQIESQSSFAGGMRDRDHPALLGPDQYYYMKNGVIRDAGLCKLRPGMYQRAALAVASANAQGATFFEPTEGNGYIIAVIDGKFYYWANSGDDLTQIGTLQIGNTTQPVEFTVGYMGTQKVLVCHVGMDSRPLYWTGDVSLDFVPFATGDTDAPYATGACVQSDRVISFGDNTLPDHIFYSDIRSIGNGGWDRTTQNIKLVTNSNEVVKAIAAYRDNSVIAQTQNSTQLISNFNSADGSTIARTTIDARFGTISPRTLQIFGTEGYFLSPDRHIRSIRRSVTSLTQDIESFPISYFNPNLMGRINQVHMGKAASIFFENYYLLAVPMDANTVNSSIIPFDFLHQQEMPFGRAPAMVGEWDNFPVQQWIVATFAGRQRLFFLSNEDGSIWEALIGDTDGVDYPAFELQTRGYQHGTSDRNKSLDSGEIKYEDSFGQLTVQAARDDRQFSTVKTVSIGSNAPGLPVDLPFNFGQPADESEYFYGYGLGDSRTWRYKYTFAGGIINFREFIYGSFVQPRTIR